MNDEITDRADDFAGVPDELERLWTPHRMVYIEGENKPPDGTAETCPFCRLPQGDDEAGLIVHRDELAYAVLNLYPYSPGHLLICPYRHVADYTDLTYQERDAVARLTSEAMTVIRAASAPHGFNLGINQGAVAGAGIAAHLHQHVVPRWSGDANFLPVIGQTKAVPQLLGDTWRLLRKTWVDLTAPDVVRHNVVGTDVTGSDTTGQEPH
ncbi:HIT family protein [Microlunatus soli]|nr:HIT domain-containing protein [Microlunatus soli]